MQRKLGSLETQLEPTTPGLPLGFGVGLGAGVELGAGAAGSRTNGGAETPTCESQPARATPAVKRAANKPAPLPWARQSFDIISLLLLFPEDYTGQAAPKRRGDCKSSVIHRSYRELSS